MGARQWKGGNNTGGLLVSIGNGLATSGQYLFHLGERWATGDSYQAEKEFVVKAGSTLDSLAQIVAQICGVRSADPVYFL